MSDRETEARNKLWRDPGHKPEVEVISRQDEAKMLGCELVFVYGTLKRGYGNSVRCLQETGATFLGEAISVEAKFTLQSAGVPFLSMVPQNGAKIAGEIFVCPPPSMQCCDQLEGHPRAYKRELQKFLVLGEVVDAWVYLWPIERGERGANVEPVDGVITWDPGANSYYKDDPAGGDDDTEEEDEAASEETGSPELGTDVAITTDGGKIYRDLWITTATFSKHYEDIDWEADGADGNEPVPNPALGLTDKQYEVVGAVTSGDFVIKVSAEGELSISLK